MSEGEPKFSPEDVQDTEDSEAINEVTHGQSDLYSVENVEKQKSQEKVRTEGDIEQTADLLLETSNIDSELTVLIMEKIGDLNQPYAFLFHQTPKVWTDEMQEENYLASIFKHGLLSESFQSFVKGKMSKKQLRSRRYSKYQEDQFNNIYLDYIDPEMARKTDEGKRLGVGTPFGGDNWAFSWLEHREGDRRLEHSSAPGSVVLVVDPDLLGSKIRRKFDTQTHKATEPYPLILHRLKSDAIIGLVVDAAGLEKAGVLRDQLRKCIQSQLLALHKTSELVPIYDSFGNLLWPKQMRYEEVKQFVAEREAKKKVEEGKEE